MNKKLFAIVSIIIMFVSVYLASPYYAVYSIRAAALEGNADKFSGYVDYPKLRENLKATFKAKMAEELIKSEDVNIFSAVGEAFASSIVDSLVDSLVTPESLAMVLKNGMKEKNDRAKENKETPSVGGKDEAESENKSSVDYTSNYRTLNVFAITLHKNSEEEDDNVSIIFERYGLLSWRLTKIEML
jgi:hypothetical protein